MKKLLLLVTVCCVVGVLGLASVASATVKAICVPWQPSNLSAPHYTYSGAEITLKGIARGGATEYRWDFGDSFSTSWTAISNPYNLGVKHTYSGVVGQLYLATLYVRDASGEDQDTYRVRIYNSSDVSNPVELDVRINMSIDEGLWYLHTNMVRNTYAAGSPGYGQPYGYWDPSYYPLAAVGTAVGAFQMHGSKANMDYDSDPYVETVQRALNYLLYYTYAFSIGVQTYGNPDTNGNGIGLVANQSSYLNDSRQTYIGGICMVALASSGAPDRVASVGGANVYGRLYKEIVQDMVDFFAYGQDDSGTGRGGWRYYANYGDSDMSTTQWPPLGMLAAKENMGSTIPQFVRDELILFLDYTQNNELNENNGGFGYNSSTSYLNITKAAAGIICHEFLGTPLTDPKVKRAIGYIYRHWNDTGTSWDDTTLLGNSYGMYGVMKAFRIPEPDITKVSKCEYDGTQPGDQFDWYYTPSGQSPQTGMASYNVTTQQSNGSWDDNVGSNPVYDAFCTGWRVLTLLKGVTVIPPEATICDCDEQEYNLSQDIHLDGSCSSHADRNRTIVSYEWDFDYNGVFSADASGVETTKVGGYNVAGHYPVALRVTDDNPEYLGGPQSSIYICDIYVHLPPHCPHAYADGPYIGWIGIPVTLDASTSWDPDNEIASYEWDLDNDGLFGAADGDCFGKPSDAVGVKPEWTWDAPYLGVIGLKITDEAGFFLACSDIDYSTVEIGNHAPTSDPDGPYQATPGDTITLSGTGSFDPDPGDSITYAWDLDNDGEFDDSTAPKPDFTVGTEIGKIYNICLKVTDSFAKYDVACTTIEIIRNRPPVAECKNVTVSADNNCQADASIDNGSYDPDGDLITLTQSSAGPYGLGDTLVTLTVTDSYGATATCTGTVTVVDKTPPTIVCPPDVNNVEQTSLNGTPVNLGIPTVSDNCDTEVAVTNDAPAVFPLGSTIVTWTAVDDSGNSTTCTQTVTVVDTTPPVIANVSASPNSLWPPNHKMVPVKITCVATDICDADPVRKILSVTSNQPLNDCGDGNTEPDWEITGALTVNLRAERAGCRPSEDRIYTITVECFDVSGNRSVSSTTVKVPHDQKK